jgi:hypothetical protein
MNNLSQNPLDTTPAVRSFIEKCEALPKGRYVVRPTYVLTIKADDTAQLVFKESEIIQKPSQVMTFCHISSCGAGEPGTEGSRIGRC